jgi:hypothetical protein
VTNFELLEVPIIITFVVKSSPSGKSDHEIFNVNPTVSFEKFRAEESDGHGPHVLTPLRP